MQVVRRAVRRAGEGEMGGRAAAPLIYCPHLQLVLAPLLQSPHLPRSVE